MKKNLFLICCWCFSLSVKAEQNIRVNFLNQKIEVRKIKPFTGKASLTLDNKSYKNFTLRLIKNEKSLKFINLEMSSTKTIDVELAKTDSLYLVPYNPSMKMLSLVSSD